MASTRHPSPEEKGKKEFLKTPFKFTKKVLCKLPALSIITF